MSVTHVRQGPSPSGGGPCPSPRRPANALTDDDLAEFMRLVAAGLSRRELAERLVLSDDGVARRRKTAMARLGARNMAHAVHRAHEEGWLRPRRLRPVEELAPCGSPGAYRRHQRRGEPIDDACRRAESARCMAYQRATGRRPAKDAA